MILAVVTKPTRELEPLNLVASVADWSRINVDETSFPIQKRDDHRLVLPAYTHAIVKVVLQALRR